MSLKNQNEMPKEKALELFENGAILIFLDVPIGTEFGIDYNSWLVGEKFKGVKMIPPGFHFIYYSAKSRDGQSAPRSGFMYFFKKKEILYKRWDPVNETIKEETTNCEDDEIERFILNKQELDQYLGAYPFNNYKKWISLTSFINEFIVSCINPLNKMVTSATPYISSSSTTESRKNGTNLHNENKRNYRYYANNLYSDVDENCLLPHMELMPGSELRFTPIPRLLHPQYSKAEDVTWHCMDRSFTLMSILDSYKSEHPENYLLGELQLSFICFIVGQVFDAFEQWKRLVDLVASSPDSMSKHAQLYADFIFVLHFQLKEIPQDFFTDIVSSDNFLASTMTKFFENICCVSEAPDDVRDKAKRFRASLEKKFDLTFENGDDEYLPVVLDL